MLQHKLTYNAFHTKVNSKKNLNIFATTTAILGVLTAACAETHVAQTLGTQSFVALMLLVVCPLLGLAGMAAAGKSDNNPLFGINACVFLAVFIITMVEFLVM